MIEGGWGYVVASYLVAYIAVGGRLWLLARQMGPGP